MSTVNLKSALISAAIALPAPVLIGAGISASIDPPTEGGWSVVWGEGRVVALYAVTWLICFLVAWLSAILSPRAARETTSVGVDRSRERVPSDIEADVDREEGTVKWFNANKGFGFITRSTGEDIFVHFRAIRGRGHRVLKQGQVVRFRVAQSEKGLQADDVSVVGQP